MALPNGADIQELIDGLTILKTYKSDAQVVTSAFQVLIPEVLVASISGPDQTSLDSKNWLQHPVYLCYYYPCYPS